MEERLPIPIKDAIPTIGLITFNSGRSFDFLHSIVNRGTIEYVYLERRGEEEQKEEVGEQWARRDLSLGGTIAII